MTRAEDSFLISSEQEKLLEDACRVVKTEAFEMKRCLDRQKLMDALKHASQMLAELRTSALTPKYYYRLYIDVTNELQHLETYLSDEYEKGRKVADLYELVQYAGNIVPRLYLLITVGVVYMKAGEETHRDLLKDLVEMCRGVQHPLRGLFLRNYLLQCTRNLLPDCAESGSSSVKDAIDFIMVNFGEMNKLWVRMQHQGPTREREKRERERMELRILVGTNLVRLSQLEHLTIDLYSKVLPGILEQAVSCKDAISQEYLMECVIQVFPDEFHLATLHEFLQACAELHQNVQMKNVLIALIDRLAFYAISESGSGIPSSMQLFDVFSSQIETVIASRDGIAPEDIVALQTALVNLALKCYPDRQDYADKVFASTCKIFAKSNLSRLTHSSSVGRELLKFLRIPVDAYANVLRLLRLPHYGQVLGHLDYRGRTQTAAYILLALLDRETRLSQAEEVEGVLALATSLLVDQDDQPQGDGLESNEDFGEEQTLVARLVNLIQADNADQQFILLNAVRKCFGGGGKYRMKHTLPAVVFACYKLALRYRDLPDKDEKWEAKVGKIFVFCMNTISALIKTSEQAKMPLRLYLQGAMVADRVRFANSATVAYEFVSKAFSLYEDEMSDSRSQLDAIYLLIGTIEQISVFSEENHEPLRNQCALAAAKLFKKPDQCRAVCAVAHLFWSSRLDGASIAMHDAKRVGDCLRKALRIALQCMDPAVQVQLYTQVLDHYVFFFEAGCSEITVGLLQEVVGKIRESLAQLEPGNDTDQIHAHFRMIVEHLRASSVEGFA